MTPEKPSPARLLAAERERVATNEAGLAAELRSILEASDQANLDDEHDPEGATVGYERARVASLLEEARIHLAQIDGADDRLSAGVYGDCIGCGRKISSERLTVHPSAQTCIACASAPIRRSLHR